MKTFKEFVNEAANSIALKAGEQKQAIDQTRAELTTQLTRILPDSQGWKVAVKESALGGSVSVTIYNENSATNNIPENSKTLMSFMMHLTDGFGKEADISKVSWEMLQGKRVAKYRKISSTRSVSDANSKLVKWIAKVKPELDAIENI